MTLSFMALLVIPALKLSDLGLFDGGEVRVHAAICVIAIGAGDRDRRVLRAIAMSW